MSQIQVWVYVLSENLTDAEYTMTSEGEKYEGVKPSFFDTTLISEDGLRFFSPSIKIGPGFKGSLVIENTGGVPIYLVDMVIMGESLWINPQFKSWQLLVALRLFSH